MSLRLGRASRGIRGVVILVAGIMAGLATMPLRLVADRGEVAAWAATVAGLMLLIAGALADRRAEANPTGMLMAASGVAIFTEDLIKSWQPLVHTAGLVLVQASTPLLVHAVLAYPRGRVGGRPAHTLVAVSYLALLGLPLAMAFFDGSSPIDRSANLLLVRDDPGTHAVLFQVNEWAMALVAFLVIITVGFRSVRTTAIDRRVMLPLAIGVVLCAGFAIGRALLPTWHPATTALVLAFYAGVVAFATAFLTLVLRVGSSLATLVELAPALSLALSLDRVEALIARALRDPSVQLGAWDAARGGFVRADGSNLDLRPAPAVAVDRHRVAAIRRWNSGWTDPLLVTSILTLVSTQLDARTLATDARAGVMHDLHDGAQQHLTALALRLRLLEDRPDLAEGVRSSALAETRVGIEQAQAELRHLSRGQGPSLLRLGLPAALQELAARTPLPVDLDLDLAHPVSDDDARLSYFIAAEALANTLRHARATRVALTCRSADGHMVVRVRDDGAGGACLGEDGGLRGLQDRLTVVGGTLTLTDDGGTLLVATWPCEEGSCESS